MRTPRGTSVTAVALATLVILGWTPLSTRSFLLRNKFPYIRVATFLHAQMQKEDVIVAGWGMRFTLSQFFERRGRMYEQPDVYVNRINREARRLVDGSRLLRRRPGVSQGRKTRVKHFGKIEIAIYNGRTPRALLQQWRSDLLLRTGGRVVPPFQGDYELLGAIEERLPSGESANHGVASRSVP